MKRFLVVMTAVALAAPIALSDSLTFYNVELDSGYVAPGELVLAQKIQMEVTVSSVIENLTVKNTASNPVKGSEIEYIEVRRDSETGPVLKKQSTGLSTFETKGVTVTTVSTPSIRTFAVGTHHLYIWIKLKPGVPLERKLALGATKVGSSDVVYPPYAATFTVGPSPEINFIDVPSEEITVYRGQRFLAGRIEVDAGEVPFETTISRLLLTNIASGAQVIRLSGTYIAEIEVRRASDYALLGEATTAEIAKLTTTGTAITTSSNNKIPAYSTVDLEIWITLKSDAPTGHKLWLQAVVRCGGTDFTAGGNVPKFVVGAPAGADVGNLDLDDGQVFSHQRFLAQRIQVEDNDLDPYDVTINSLVVRNVATEYPLSETQVARIEAVRARDGALMGSVTNASGLNSGGVRITTNANNVILDDTAEVIELWVTLKDNVPDGRTIQLRTTIWHTEDNKTFDKDAEGNAVFTTGLAETAQGLERSEPVKLADRTVFQGARFLAQHLILEDKDTDPYDVTITSLLIRNGETAVPLADQHVAKIEVRRKSDGKLLGEATNPVNLSSGGVRVTTAANNLVPDDNTVELEIWITLKDTAPKGRKLQLVTVVWHTEGMATFQTYLLSGPAKFTTDIGQAPQNVDFSWTPEKPEAGKEVTFTPSSNITDPTGLANATFSWDFGDGTTKETKGSAAVKHTYTRGGTFSVTLTVTNVGSLSSSKTKEIEVIGKQPVVDFDFSPAEPMAGEEVSFTAKVTDPATPPLTPYTYEWSFGDGSTSNLANPKHPYTTAGTYTVTFKVTNNRGETGSKSKTITVKERAPTTPTITSLTADTTMPELNQVVTFSASATAPADDPITNWKWNFGDGTVEELTEPKGTTVSISRTHAYATAGTYVVQVQAKNNAGWSAARTITIYVRRPGVLLDFQILDNPAQNQCRIQVAVPPQASNLRLYILDVAGRLILEKSVAAGTFTWDLKDQNGRNVPNGMYFLLVTATVEGKTERSEIGRILVRR